VRKAAALALSAMLFAAACGPKRPAGYFVYEGRRGDSLAALSARFGGDERLAKTLAREAGRAADAPFEAGERVAVPFESLNDDAAKAFALVHEARGARARGDYAGALAALAEARSRAQQDPAIAFELGATYYEAGDYARAAASLAAARALAPEDEEVALTFALAAAEAGDVDGAVAALEDLVAARPDLLYALYVLGEVEVKAGRYPAGRHHLFEYLKRHGDGLVAGYAREAIKASARAEMEAAARALKEAPPEKEEVTPAREAGTAPAE
jgi:tetratricopeptide (TPR) repeat protein